MKNKIALIVPYFGRFNNYFELYLKSCAKNPNIDWLFFTDDKTPFPFPPNVHVHYTTFERLREKIQSLFDFKITLHNPYKLCDYKGAYGFIFQDYLKAYDFWGFCDADLIWGDLEKIFTDDLLDKNDRLGFRGHLTIFRNTEKINRLFLDAGEDELSIDYKQVFTTRYCCHFDELLQWENVFKSRGLRQWNACFFADVCSERKNFSIAFGEHPMNPQIFKWENGKIIRYFIDESTGTPAVKTDEWIYVHLQKRKMGGGILSGKNARNTEGYLIVPNEFLECPQEIDCALIKKYSSNTGIYWEYKKMRVQQIIQNVRNGALKFRLKNLLKRFR